MLFRQLSAAITVVQLLGAFKVTHAQTSSVICPSSYNWAGNSLGQNPCIISAFLLRPCTSSVVDVPVLPPNQHYDPGDYSDCNCNTVVYSLVSACADCQSRTYDLWTQWSVNCTNVYRGLYPHDIPVRTAVPAWAYLDVLTSNQYNATAAMADIASPESTAFVPASSTGVSPSSASSGTVTTSSAEATYSSITSTALPQKKKTNVGAIAGGAAGGVVVIVLAVVLVAWLFNRNRRQVAPVADYKIHNGGVDKITPMTPPPPSNPYDLTSTLYNTTPVYAPPKLYDPSDPTTFPTTAPTPQPQMEYSSVPQSPSSYASAPQSTYPSSYTPSQTYTPPLPQSAYTAPSFQSAYTSPSGAMGYHGPPHYMGAPQI